MGDQLEREIEKLLHIIDEFKNENEAEPRTPGLVRDQLFIPILNSIRSQNSPTSNRLIQDRNVGKMAQITKKTKKSIFKISIWNF